MAEKLKEALISLLFLDSESATQLVSRAEALSGSELQEFLYEILGADSPVVESYLTSRNGPPQSQKSTNASTSFSRPASGPSSRPDSRAGSSSQSRLDSGSRSTVASGSQSPLPELNTRIVGQFGLKYSKGAWDHSSAKKEPKKTNTNSTKSANKLKVESLKDIELALKQLDLKPDGKRRRCTCRATRHPLFELAPNCLKCGKIICTKEGLGPCTDCGAPLLTDDQLASISDILKAERDDIASSMGRKAREAAGLGTTVSQLGLKNNSSQDEATKAQDRLNRLLQYQETSAQRTKIIDQYSDFETPDAGINQWASPLEQAQQLKLQQRRMRKLEKQRLAQSGRGQKVLSINLQGKKVYAKTEDAVVQESSSDSEDEAQRSRIEADNAEAKSKIKSYWSAKDYGKDFFKPVYKSTTGAKADTKFANIEGGVVAMDDEEAEDRVIAF